MSSAYRYPARGHVYRHCVMCRRPFRVCNSQLARRSARSCTVRCYHAALRAFSEALASDRMRALENEHARLEALDAAFRTHGLSVNAAYLNPGSVDLYEWPGLVD